MSRKNISFLSALCLLTFTLSAQIKPDHFERSWKRVDSLSKNKGLTQSALAETEKIYQLARKEGNEAQLIKSLIYKMNFQNEIQEDGQKKNIKTLESEISSAEGVSKSILNSILAEAYLIYFRDNRYRFYNRSKTVNFFKADLDTWSIDDFRSKISGLYANSLNKRSLLEKTRLENYEPIIIRGNKRYLRPTLYDLLAHRALDYFKNDEVYINKPADVFQISDSDAFAEKMVFANHHFYAPDTSSSHFKALLLFQELILFHLKDSGPDALVDVDLERIEFANTYGIMENRAELYLGSLLNLTREYGYRTAAQQAWYLQALWYYAKGNQYKPIADTANRYALLTAKEICEKVILQKDSSEGKFNCQELLKRITRRELDMQTEKVNLPGEPFRVLVKYKNLLQVYFRLIKVDGSIRKILGFDSWDDPYWKRLASLPPFRVFSDPFPETTDYQNHAIEIKIDALPVGEWALVASANPDFNAEKNPLAVNYFHVSAIAYINNGLDYFVLNRETGQPLARTNVQAWYPYYDRSRGQQLEREGESFLTDEHGFFSITPPKTNKNEAPKLEFSTGNDHLFVDYMIPLNIYRSEDDNENNQDSERYEADNLKTFFFTDRAIYRPGQIVFFKGIVVTKDFDTKKSKMLTGFPAKIFLYGAGKDKLDSLTLNTNEFGSFHGKFLLPAEVLNGEFRIAEDSSGSEQVFSVEEYKRPDFYVEFDQPEGSYRLRDTITIRGSAKAFAGNTIFGARGRYHVLRIARFPHPWSSWSRDMPFSQPTEVAYGDLKTDGEGKFTISFPAIPDNSISRNSEPVFNYLLTADITDINGETRTGRIDIPVSYQTMSLSIEAPGGDNLPADSFSHVIIRSENLSGTFEPGIARVSIYRLKSPERLIRPRYWEQPDQFIMTREEYLALFPHDEYSNETQKETWEIAEKTIEEEDSLKMDGLVRLPERKFLPGWYLVEARSKDKYGAEIKDLKYIRLLDSKTGRPADPQYNWDFDADRIAEPGDSLNARVGSSANQVFLIQRIDRNSDRERAIDNLKSTGDYAFTNLNNEMKPTGFRITEADRGGFGFSYAFVKNNRVFTGGRAIQVPWSNKELKINHGVFRDRTLPGTTEQWTFNITGFKKDRISAELLAAMYDGSLDQFKKQGWVPPDLYNTYNYQEWNNNYSNFSINPSLMKFINDFTPNPFQNTYDRLLDFVGSTRILIGGRSVLRADVQYKTSLNSEVNGAMPVGLAVDSVQFAHLKLPGMARPSLLAEEKAVSPEDAIGGQSILTRKNFNETAFFFPDLKTDSLGNLSFSFTLPEALTEWKWMTLAHTKDLSFGYAEGKIITQKQLMTQPNPPRFLREGDHIGFSVKIVNLTDSELTGQAELQLIDATSGESVDGWFQNMQANQFFTIGSKQSAELVFPLEVPFRFSKPVTYRIVARAPFKRTGAVEYSDGEEATLPVLSNRALITESLPLTMDGKQEADFRFERLLASGSSETISNHLLTVEWTGNPVWSVVQALPFLIDDPYACAEQTFNHFYANALAASIVNRIPAIRETFAKWEKSDTSALLSNLQKNQELKSVLLQETPWVMDAKNESQSKKNLARYFDQEATQAKLVAALTRLEDMQSENGSFSWFKTGPEDRYITQYILTGIGHLIKLGAIPPPLENKINGIVKTAIAWLDKNIKSDYDKLQKNKSDLNTNQLGPLQIQYLYMRSFFPNEDLPGETFGAMHYYRKQAQQYWLLQNKYMQGMIALALFRTGDLQKAKEILASLKQNAILGEETGMYWKDNSGGYYWQQAPVETESLLIEAFQEIGKEEKAVEAMKTWLLRQKQTANWNTSRSTADACYALLLQGKDWLKEQKTVEIRLGNTTISSAGRDKEQGSGYFKKTIESAFINPGMGNIRVALQPGPDAGSQNLSRGAVYWQYFEDLDKINPASSGLRISKKLFVEKNTSGGIVLEPVADGGTLKTGDKVKIRIEIRADRDMEYVHMKDMRASCLEPLNVLSGYRWQGGLGYYESTKDASANFFFDRLPKGVYIFEYPLFVANKGSFSNGIATIECMYAPEFSAHSQSQRLQVGGQE